MHYQHGFIWWFYSSKSVIIVKVWTHFTWKPSRSQIGTLKRVYIGGITVEKGSVFMLKCEYSSFGNKQMCHWCGLFIVSSISETKIHQSEATESILLHQRSYNHTSVSRFQHNQGVSSLANKVVQIITTLNENPSLINEQRYPTATVAHAQF